jgi:hypothetical protein
MSRASHHITHRFMARCAIHRARRAGVTIVELLVAITTLLIVLAIGSRVARQLLESELRLSITGARRHAISDALLTLARHAENIDPLQGDLIAARDTALELLHPVGLSVVCKVHGDTLTLSAERDSVAWSPALPRGVATGDRVRVWNEATAAWQQRDVIAVSAAGGTCGDSLTPWPDRAAQRVRLSDSIAALRPGALVRVLQPQRWSLVRSGTGDWSLSLASWEFTRGALGTPQPVFTPLAAPTAPAGPGLDVRAVDATGTVLDAASLARARSLLILLRSAQHSRFGGISDSVRINVGHH